MYPRSAFVLLLLHCVMPRTRVTPCLRYRSCEGNWTLSKILLPEIELLTVYNQCRKWLPVSSAKLLKVGAAHCFQLHCLRLYTGDIPSFKLHDSAKVFAFLDINPLSKGHAV